MTTSFTDFAAKITKELKTEGYKVSINKHKNWKPVTDIFGKKLNYFLNGYFHAHEKLLFVAKSETWKTVLLHEYSHKKQIDEGRKNFPSYYTEKWLNGETENFPKKAWLSLFEIEIDCEKRALDFAAKFPAEKNLAQEVINVANENLLTYVFWLLCYPDFAAKTTRLTYDYFLNGAYALLPKDYIIDRKWMAKNAAKLKRVWKMDAKYPKK